MITTQEYKIGDCLNLLPDIPDKSVDLIIADPPYYRIKNDAWDNQWKTFEDYISWLELIAIEMKRVLKDNGSLYLFGDDERIAYVQVMMDKYFSFLNHLIWYKRNNIPIKYAHNFRKFAPVSERILFYSMLNINHFKPLRQYFKEFQEAINIPKIKIVKLIGQSADHCFRWNSTQWDLPTLETYDELCKLPLKNDFIKRNYESLRDEYDTLRRIFNYTTGMYEVFDIAIINSSENTTHSTTKPSALIERLVKTSSNPGDMILDPFLGSGSTMQACVNINRNFQGFEMLTDWEYNYKKILDSKKNLYQLSRIFNRSLS